ncbi:isochorismatase family protein [Arthrobacter sp. 35W]|uniref:isochorismatase family protein n=1 Tax=Arthrobacter sp. 35W TaxID=1132441 RepID=UPI00047CADF6|nr:isochorismatase family protein [Arthrobacter sp. 35W]
MATIPGHSNTALLVIDMQVDVLACCFDRDSIMDRTAALVNRARADSIPVIWVQHADEELVHGSDGWQIAAPLVPLDTDPNIFKNYRDSFVETTLRGVLSAAKVSRLVIAGAQSDYCVRTTAQRAAADGYDVVLVSDCHTTTDTEFGGVGVSGEQIVAHTNQYFQGFRYPGQQIGIATHDVVGLGGPL